MKKLRLKDLQNSSYEKIRNYFSEENIDYFGTELSKLEAVDLEDKIIFLDNIQFEYHGREEDRIYNVKEFNKKENKIKLLFETLREREAIEIFEEIIEE